MGEKIIGAVSVVGIFLKRFFMGWYSVEQKVDRLEEDDKDIRARLARIEDQMSLLICLEEGGLKRPLPSDCS